MSEKHEQNLVADVLSRMRKVAGAKNDAQLAVYLGVARSVVSAWKTRNKFPYAACGQLSEEFQVSMDWLLTGEGPIRRGEPEPEQGPTLELPDEVRSIVDVVLSLDASRRKEVLQFAEGQLRTAQQEARNKQELIELREALARLQPEKNSV